jgi:hypothetical protein
VTSISLRGAEAASFSAPISGERLAEAAGFAVSFLHE